MMSKPKLAIAILIIAVFGVVALVAAKLVVDIKALKTGQLVQLWSSKDGTETPSQFMYAIFPTDKCGMIESRLVLVNQSEVAADDSCYNMYDIDGNEAPYDKSCFTFSLPDDLDSYVNAYMNTLIVWGGDTDIQDVSVSIDQNGIHTLVLSTDLGTQESYSYSLKSNIPTPLTWTTFKPGR